MADFNINKIYRKKKQKLLLIINNKNNNNKRKSLTQNYHKIIKRF